jgi:hypothetical protein
VADRAETASKGEGARNDALRLSQQDDEGDAQDGLEQCLGGQGQGPIDEGSDDHQCRAEAGDDPQPKRVGSVPAQTNGHMIVSDALNKKRPTQHGLIGCGHRDGTVLDHQRPSFPAAILHG